ncbi:MAG: HAD hydrolase-like protein [Anaerolineaceae bacterium]|nr:HAD hydrolase-like protein [Anaerolineaceae bacterium]
MTLLKNTQIEIIKDSKPRGQIRFAIFDFDGTISTLREGWQDVMQKMMMEFLRLTPRCENDEMLSAVVKETIDVSTGKQTIYQMISLRDMVLARGGEALEAKAYKAIFNTRLLAHIEHRVEGVRSGRIAPESMMVPGALNMLDAMRERGVPCFLASGTDQPYVLAESSALGVDTYFEEIYGALENFQDYSKRMVIERIIQENDLRGAELVGFGDGFVEIEDVNTAGGIAVGVASDEVNRKGVNKWKRERLVRAGADIIIPDFQEYKIVINWLFNAKG